MNAEGDDWAKRVTSLASKRHLGLVLLVLQVFRRTLLAQH